MDPRVQKLVDEANAALRRAPPLGGTVLVDLGPDGKLLVGSEKPPVVGFNHPGLSLEADAVITTSLDEVADLEGGGSVFFALLSGKVKVTGNEALAEKFGEILKGAAR